MKIPHTIGKQHSYTGTTPVQLALDGEMTAAVELLCSEFYDLTHTDIWEIVNDVPNKRRRNRLAKLVRRQLSAKA
jgi:hypothetical protein